MASEIYPAFQVRALFMGFELLNPVTPTGKTKIRLDFAVDSVNINGQKKNHIPMELAAQIGAVLSCKVDPPIYDLSKHLLKENLELSLTVCPKPWKMQDKENNASGMLYDFIGVEKFSLDVIS